MDRRRAAGALLALTACIACSAAAPTASNHTALDLYEGASEGCYYNFQHYGEGDRIMTNEPCLNCTCHNRMLMCYLRVCPFTKPIGQDCTVEKRADQCCPIVTCPDVPVDLLTSTSTSSPAEYGATGLGKLDKYGCSISGKYFPEGSKVPPTPNKPCEHCYCIRNMTTCVMQECTLHVDGCTPIYHKDVCCPVRYSCDHPEDEIPLLDDMSTTVRPTPGFLLTTTTLSPVTQMTQDCVHNDQVIADGASITTEKACEHCYCMKGDIVCVVQECGAPMENEGKNCTSLPPREGQCCPDTYICEGEDLSSEISSDSTTDSILEKLTTLSPPRRTGVEGSGYRNEPSEGEGSLYEPSTEEPELEGSGEEHESTLTTGSYKPLITDKPAESEEMSPDSEDAQQYIPVTTKAPFVEIPETTPKLVEPDIYQSYSPAQEDVKKNTTDLPDEEHLKPHEHITIATTFTPESDEKITTDSGESLNTVPDISFEQEHEKPHEHYNSVTGTTPSVEGSRTTTPQYEETKNTPSGLEQDENKNSVTESEHLATSPGVTDDIAIETTEKALAELEHVTEKETTEPGSLGQMTAAPVTAESETHAPKESDVATSGDIVTDKESSKPDFDHRSTTSSSVSGSTELDHALNTVAVNEEGYIYPRPISEEADKLTSSDEGVTATEKIAKDDSTESLIYTTTPVPVQSESEKTTAEPDKGLNTIPNEIDDESSSQPSPSNKTGSSSETKSPETSVIVDVTEPQELDIISPTTSESLTASSESHVTKADQYTITTEPSFRREDEASVTTEKPKEEPVQTTIKPEFVDEGLIPTSIHEEKLNTGSDVSIMEEDITTVMPEDVKETIDSQKPMTESSVTSESFPEKITESSSEQEDGLTTSTDKSVDVITLPAEIDHFEEPSRIPGEGDCLLSGVTYRNNTAVPSSNNCHTGCKCVSSIIKCDPIICMPPPDYMDNCQSIYDSPDSCCPTYVCDHPKETIPPQSDNQMSGTEPPSPHPVIECRGDQCELSEPTKMPTESYESCTSGDCLPTVDHNSQTSDCGPEGCTGVKEPVSPQQPGEKAECTDEKCKPAELPPTHSQISPVKPCDGDDCKEFEVKPTPQLCENENDCRKIDMPVTQTVSCEGDSCKNINCGSGGCDHNVVISLQDNLHSLCREEDGCKPDKIIPSDCTGDLPCRRKEISSAEGLPSKCAGVDCAQKTDISVSQLSTESLPEESPATTETIDRQPVQDLPTEGPILTDNVEIDTKKPVVVVEEHTDKPSSVVEKATEIPDIVEKYEDKPVFDKEQGPKDSVIIDEDHTDKTILAEEEGTKIPDFAEGQTDKPGLYEIQSTKVVEEGTKSPEITEEYTHKPAFGEEEGTKVPEVVEQQTAKPILVDAESTKMPEVNKDRTDKPTLVEEVSTKVPGTTEEITTKPVSDETEKTKIPEFTEEHTSKTDLVEEEATKIPNFTEEHTVKQTLVEDESTRPSDMFEKHTEKPGEEYSSKLPDIIEEHTEKVMSVKEDKPKEQNVTDEPTTKTALLDEESTKLPYNEGEPTDNPIFIKKEETESTEISKESTNKPALAEEESTKIPAFAEGQTDKPGLVETERTKIPDVTEVYTNKPVLIKEESTKGPEITEAHTHKPALDEEEGTKVSEAAEEQTDKPSSFERESTKIPDVTEEQTYKPESVTKDTDIPVLLEETATRIPDIAVEYTNKPAVIDDVGPVTTDIEKDNTDKTISLEPEVVTDTTILPEDESKEKPILVDEDLPEKPIIFKDDSEKKPNLIDIGSTSEPVISETESTVYPQEIERDSTKKPVLIDEDSTSSDVQITNKPTTIGDKTEEQAPIIEEDTKIPVVDDTDQPIATVDKGIETSERPEYYPQTPSDQDTRQTEESVVHEPEKEATSKYPVEEHTETVHTELEPVTKSPIDEQQTTFEIDSHVLDDKFGHEDEPKPDEQFTGVKEPTLVSELEYTEISTESPLSETISHGTLPPSRDQGTYSTAEHGTTSQEPETVSAESKKPELTTESIEKITKSSEPETITEGEIYTDMPDQESSVTKSPEEVIIEPQEGRPSSDISEVVIDETTNKVFEEHSTSAVPESHVTESTQYESSSPITEPETTRVTEVVDSETQKIVVSESHETESEITPTQSISLTDLTKQDVKTDQPEILTAEKEEMITDMIISQVTEPVKEFTEIDDSLVTRRDDSTTKYYGETTERLEPTATEKLDESSETAITSSETPLISDTITTKETVLSYTKSHEEHTKSPELKETKPIDSDVSSATTTESSEQKIPEPSKPIIGYQDQPTKILTTLPPVFKVTEAQEKPDVSINDITSQEEKTTATPMTGKPSEPEIEIPEEQTATKISDDYVTESAQSEKPISIESELIDIPKTTALPEIVKQPEVTEAPELQHTVSLDTDLKLHPEEDQKSSTEYTTTFDERRTELLPTKVSTEPSMSLVTESHPEVSVSKDSSTEKQDAEPTLHEVYIESHDQITGKPEDAVVIPDETTPKQLEDVTKSADQTTAKTEFSETTPYLIELEEHTHKIVEDVSMASPSDIDITTPSLTEEDHTPKSQEPTSTESSSVDYTHKLPEDVSMIAQTEGELQGLEAATEKKPIDDIDTVTEQVELADETTHQPTESVPKEVSEKLPETPTSIKPDQTEKTTVLPPVHDKIDVDQTDITTSKLSEDSEGTTPTAFIVTEESPISESDIVVSIDKETSATEKPLHPTEASRRTTVPEEDIILSTTIATPIKEEVSTSVPEDKYSKPEEKPTSEAVPPTTAADIPKPPTEVQPIDETTPDEGGHFPETGYGEPDYVEEDQAFGPGTCRYGGKVYVSAQQIPRDDPCDFCFCFRSDIICLQQSCPPPIHGCHEEPIQGFCCPRYECPVSMATTVNVTTTTTTTTTTLPPHFPTHSYKGAAQRRGCQIKGHTYKVGEVVRSSSGPCLHCTCGGDGQMKCDPKACTPEPMLRQMIAAAVSAKRRR